jgi:trigger factor
VLQDLGLNKDSAEDAAKTFAMTITKVGLLEKAELNEELYKKVYPSKEIKTEAEFREAVREDMAGQWKSQTDNQLHHSIYHELLDHTSISFPESFLKRWLLNGGEKPKTPEEVEKEYPSFVQALKWSLITEKLNAGNNFEVGPEDIKAAARVQLFSYLGGLPQGGDQPWIEDYVNRMMQDRRFVDETYQRLKTDKMFQWVETQVTPAEKTISSEEFNAMQAEHAHTHGEGGHDHGDHEGHDHEGHDHGHAH